MRVGVVGDPTYTKLFDASSYEFRRRWNHSLKLGVSIIFGVGGFSVGSFGVGGFSVSG